MLVILFQHHKSVFDNWSYQDWTLIIKLRVKHSTNIYHTAVHLHYKRVTRRIKRLLLEWTDKYIPIKQSNIIVISCDFHNLNHPFDAMAGFTWYTSILGRFSFVIIKVSPSCVRNLTFEFDLLLPRNWQSAFLMTRVTTTTNLLVLYRKSSLPAILCYFRRTFGY